MENQPIQNEQFEKKVPFYKKWYVWFGVAIVAIAFAVFSGNSDSPSTAKSQISTTKTDVSKTDTLSNISSTQAEIDYMNLSKDAMEKIGETSMKVASTLRSGDLAGGARLARENAKIMRDAYYKLKSANVPPRLAEIHQLNLDAMDIGAKGSEKAARGLETGDVPLLKEAMADIELSTKKVNQSTSLIKSLTP